MADVSMRDASDGPPPLFHEVVFHIIPKKLSEETISEIRGLLLSNGAVEAPPRKPTTSARCEIDLEETTHIISETSDFPGYAEAERLMIPVVTTEWVRFSLEKQKLGHIRPFNPDPRFFFREIIATVSELPPGDKEAIVGGVIAMGGQYSNQLTRMTTHIIALNLESEKCKQAMAKKLKVKIVLPHWIDDCLKLGRKIDEKPYEFPDPEILRVDASESMEIPHGPNLKYTHAQSIDSDPPMLPRSGHNIFDGKRVLLGQDLELSKRTKLVIEGIIQQTKGKLVDNPEQADVYVGHFRDGDEYVIASQRHADVGNLTWLYWMIAHGEWTNPTNRLLHYPLPRDGIPGMAGKAITISNYSGDARLFLENLIEACGAKFTKSMKADNTHLITARAHSEKCVAAKEWNINMVNHLWLEDTYAQCKEMRLTDPRYTHFPRRTNLQEVVGQTRIDLEAIKKYYEFQPEDSTMAEPPATIKKTAVKKKTEKVTEDAATTPVQRKRQSNTMEEDSPLPPSTGRKAKEKASSRLHDAMMDVALYQKELKRKGGVLGGREGSTDSPEGKTKSNKRAKSEDSGDEKVAKKKKRPKPTIFLLITAYKGWLDQPQKEDEGKRILADLGVKCVDDAAQCTYLAAPQLVRTEKFCCALARAPVIVSTKWVEDCIEQEELLDTDGYLLKDKEGEKRLNLNLAQSLARAKKNGGQLLDGQNVFCTKGVHGGVEVCRKIVEANGGVCVQFKGTKKPANVPDSEKYILLSGDSAADKAMWPKFKTMAHNAGREFVIYRSDWLLETAMNQQIEWNDKHTIPGAK